MSDRLLMEKYGFASVAVKMETLKQAQKTADNLNMKSPKIAKMAFLYGEGHYVVTRVPEHPQTPYWVVWETNDNPFRVQSEALRQVAEAFDTDPKEASYAYSYAVNKLHGKPDPLIEYLTYEQATTIRETVNAIIRYWGLES